MKEQRYSGLPDNLPNESTSSSTHVNLEMEEQRVDQPSDEISDLPPPLTLTDPLEMEMEVEERAGHQPMDFTPSAHSTSTKSSTTPSKPAEVSPLKLEFRSYFGKLLTTTRPSKTASKQRKRLTGVGESFTSEEAMEWMQQELEEKRKQEEKKEKKRKREEKRKEKQEKRKRKK